MPGLTPLSMVAAFMGPDLTRKAYVCRGLLCSITLALTKSVVVTAGTTKPLMKGTAFIRSVMQC